MAKLACPNATPEFLANKHTQYTKIEFDPSTVLNNLIAPCRAVLDCDTIWTYEYVGTECNCYGSSQHQWIEHISNCQSMLSGDCGGGAGDSIGDDGGGSAPHGGGGGILIVNPCIKLKNLFDPLKANMKPTLVALQNTITPTGTGENATSFRKNSAGAVANTPVPSTGNNMIIGPVGPNIYGEAHTHPLDTYPMFSWTDVNRLLEIQQSTGIWNYEDIVNMVVVQDDYGVNQVYALVFNDDGVNTVDDVLNQPELNGCSIKEKLDKYNEEMAEKFDKDSNYERGFLRQFFGFNISLYKANSSLNNWSKLTINSITGNVITTPCN